MEIIEHITIVGNEAKLLASAAEQGGLDVEVPTCPGWDMRELLRHLSEIHLWAAAHVAQPHDKPWVDDLSELTKFWPDLAVFWPDDDELIKFYLDTNANLVHALESAPLDVEAFTFLPASSPLAMWARRQAHETAVHRFDAENAAGIASAFDAEFAADGIDELLAAFAPRKDTFPVEEARSMHIHSQDTDDHWLVTLAPDGITTTRAHGPADTQVTGTAADLYLGLWNRTEDSGIAIEGDPTLLEKWHSGVMIRWS